MIVRGPLLDTFSFAGVLRLLMTAVFVTNLFFLWSVPSDLAHCSKRRFFVLCAIDGFHRRLYVCGEETECVPGRFVFPLCRFFTFRLGENPKLHLRIAR